MSKNNSKNIKKDENENKIVTKYDKKVAKRKEEERIAKRNKVIARIVGVVAIIAVVAVIVGSIASRFNKIYNKYISVDGSNISQVEFDFYYGISKNTMLSQPFYGTMTVGDYLAYMGYDSTVDDKKQTNSQTGESWHAYFAENTLDTLKENIALLNDAEKTGFNYDSAEDDYNEFVENLKNAADEGGVSVKDYYKDYFGKYATEKNVKNYINEYLKACAYKEQKLEELKATDSEVKEYYTENKDLYDQVDYRIFSVKAVDSTSGEMEIAKNKADDFANSVSDEESFIRLCKLNAEDGDTSYESDDASLRTKYTSSEMETGVSEWLLSDDRLEGDVTVVENTTNSCYYVLYYISKSYDGSSDEDIASNVLNNKYTEYLTKLTDGMEVNTYKRF
ncbi:MAG: peptidyl-prolyl cis-trans isomerase [Eubacteriales bacterium]|nr:peptidyl-prolyl cis-trans isomerase [Eubacteriales bacterium]